VPPLVDWIKREFRSPNHRFELAAPDGVRLAGVRFDRARSATVVVYAHGFLSTKNSGAIPGFLERLGARLDLVAFDSRGHGESGGHASFGGAELADLDTVVRYARGLGYRRVVTVGSSMGGAIVIRHAAAAGGVDGVATIGAFASARPLRRPATALALHAAYGTAAGQTLASRVRGTRLGRLDLGGDQPIDVVHRVAPRPLLLIHGAWDPLIHRLDALELYERAREPKDLIVVPRGGHDHPLLRGDVADRLVAWIHRRVPA